MVVMVELETAHGLVDDLADVFGAFASQMQIDHVVSNLLWPMRVGRPAD